MRQYRSIEAFHGSEVEIEEFNNDFLQKRDEGYWGVGIYLGSADTADEVIRYSDSKKGYIHSCYVAGEFFIIEDVISESFIEFLIDNEISFNPDHVVSGESWDTYLSDVVDSVKLTRVLKGLGCTGIHSDTNIHGLQIVVFDGSDIEIFDGEGV